MYKRQVGSSLSISLICLGLTACGSAKIGSVSASPVVPSPAKAPPTTLTGNWLLAGSRVPAAYPTVSTSLYIQGNIVTGETTFFAQCTSTGVPRTVSSSGVPVTGKIANDGTFQASTGNLGSPALGTTSLAFTGNSPLAAAPSVWTGTYSLTSTPAPGGNPCVNMQTAAFTATPIASVTGTYIGLPINSNTPFGSGAVVTVQIAQGTPTLVAQGNTSRYQIPLTATLSITNSLCPFSGSTTGVSELSSIRGDSFNLFLTSGFPYGVLSGTLDDPTAKAFFGDLTSLTSVNGCPGIAFYNFRRK